MIALCLSFLSTGVHVVILLNERGVFWSFAVIVHNYFTLRMSVDSERDGFILEIVNLVKMSQEGITNEDKISCASLQLIGMNCELASCSFGLMEVESWSHFKGLTANGEANWLQFLCDVCARGHYLAEVVISNAIKVMDILLPFLFQALEHFLRDTNVGATSIDNGGVRLLASRCCCQFVSILHFLTFKGPLLHRLGPVWSVGCCRHFMKSSSATHDLLRVHSSESSV